MKQAAGNIFRRKIYMFFNPLFSDYLSKRKSFFFNESVCRVETFFLLCFIKKNKLAVTILGNIFIQLSVTVVSRQILPFDQRFDALFDHYWGWAEMEVKKRNKQGYKPKTSFELVDALRYELIMVQVLS